MSDAALRRARSLDELEAVLGSLLSPEGIAAGLGFVPDAGDVIVSSFAKCGTTWLQQIVHGLRSHGDLDFDDISRVVPWIETAADLGIDLGASQPWSPRAFKSHLAWDLVPKPAVGQARYVVSLRDPSDAALSFYRFFEGWFFEPGTIEIDAFVRRMFIERGRYYEHLESWWRRRDDDDVLLLAYEDMLDQPSTTIERVAAFIGIEADSDLLVLAREQSSFAAMKANQSKYDDVLMRTHSERVCALPPGSQSSKVSTGDVGRHRFHFSDEIAAEFDAAWASTLGQNLGLESYDTVLTALGHRVSDTG